MIIVDTVQDHAAEAAAGSSSSSKGELDNTTRQKCWLILTG